MLIYVAILIVQVYIKLFGCNAKGTQCLLPYGQHNILYRATEQVMQMLLWASNAMILTKSWKYTDLLVSYDQFDPCVHCFWLM